MARVVALLGDRYELEELIGAGGMGEVFRARDLLLERTVAVKRPSASFTGTSRERFRREARAAARLNHPHIVAVYDWGEEPASVAERRDASVAERRGASVAERQDASESYIVMEHVEGRSLRAMLQDQGSLAPVEVARVGAQIADALAHAHSKGVVHRDVKPSNVLVNTTGTVKVTDFGIAQSSASEALTEPGVVVGTAGYLAPEQVAGLSADARSDIYSLGVVLTELLTGEREVEFDVDDADATELAALRRVIARARAQDPAARYQRATEVREALHACARASDAMPAIDPARVTGEARTGLVVDVPTATVAPLHATVADPTKVLAPPPPPPAPPPSAPVPAPPAPPAAVPVLAAAVASPSVDAAAPAAPTSAVAPPRRTQRREARTLRKAERKATSSQPRPKVKPAKAERERRWRAPHVVWLVAAPVTLALVAAGFLAYNAITTRPEVDIPAVADHNLFAYGAELRAAGLEVRNVDAPSATPAGTILDVRPRPGKTVHEGDTVVVTFSAVLAEMPDVIDMSEDEAAATLRNAGLVNIQVADNFTDAVEPGTVTASQPVAHLSWAKSETVTVSIARDPSVVIPTGIVGFDEATARGRLEGIGLVVATQAESSRTKAVGTVLGVSPREGAGATRGDTVILRVSSGPKPVSVPYLIKEDANHAYDDLQDLGFVVVPKYATAPSKDFVGKVIAQEPVGGQAAEGSTITLTIGTR